MSDDTGEYCRKCYGIDIGCVDCATTPLETAVVALEARVAALTEERDFARDSADRSVREYDLANARAGELHKQIAALTAERDEWKEVAQLNVAEYDLANRSNVELHNALASAQADTQRLDWIGSRKARIEFIPSGLPETYWWAVPHEYQPGYQAPTIREAIDAARAAKAGGATP